MGIEAGGRVTRFTQTRALEDIDDYTYKSLARVTWYQLHAFLDDEDIQKRGIVILIDFSNSRGSKKTRENHLKLFRTINKSVPFVSLVRTWYLHQNGSRQFGLW